MGKHQLNRSGGNGGNGNNFKNNKNKNRFNNHHNNHNSQVHKKQSGNKINKPKPEPINQNIKAPLFNKSKLSSTWKINRKIGPGLINGQNTCFLNSVLECLTYTPPLAQYLMNEEHRKNCNVREFCALCAMETHIRRSLKEPKSFVKGAAILPGYFTGNLKALSKTLRLGRQEDAHELYMFILSAFQKASVHGLGKLPPKVEETAFIYQIFGGKLRSQLKCYSCKATSNNYEACLDLSVDLSNKANTVEKALDNFTKIDIIGSDDPNNRYKCDACKQMVKAGKQMTIYELPMMLTVHLKRFAFDLQRGYMRKITSEVKFPETLDLAPYVSKEKKMKTANYNLYAVLVHLGYGCDSGHYYAYVKAPNGQWYRMDDEDVAPVSLKEVLSQNAYMLFYQQDTANSSKPETNNDIKPETKETVEQKIPTTNVIEDATPNKKVLVDINNKKKEEITKKKSVVFEPSVISDNPLAWVVQSANKPHRSLRGNLSPPTYGANVHDESTWTQSTVKEFKQKQLEKKRRRFRVKLESKKSPWTIRH